VGRAVNRRAVSRNPNLTTRLRLGIETAELEIGLVMCV